MKLPVSERVCMSVLDHLGQLTGGSLEVRVPIEKLAEAAGLTPILARDAAVALQKKRWALCDWHSEGGFVMLDIGGLEELWRLDLPWYWRWTRNSNYVAAAIGFVGAMLVQIVWTLVAWIIQ